MTDEHRGNAAYLLQLRDDLDRLDETRWEWVAPGAMSLLTGLLSVGTLSGGILPAGIVLALASALTGTHAVRSERARRSEQRAIVERIERIEGTRPPDQLSGR